MEVLWRVQLVNFFAHRCDTRSAQSLHGYSIFQYSMAAPFFPGYLMLFCLLDPQSYTLITLITLQHSPYTFVRGLFPSLSSLPFTLPILVI